MNPTLQPSGNAWNEVAWYSDVGVPIFPLLPKCKTPATRNGFLDASTDKNVIQEWANRFPNANVGIVTGDKSGFFVLDVDLKSGGKESLQKLVDKYGPLPPTPTVETGSGGLHLYYRNPPGLALRNRTGFEPGLDIRANGGYVVAPSSIHPCGGRYFWKSSLRPLGEDLAIAPNWLLDLIQSQSLASPEKKTESFKDLVRNGALAGTRNHSTASLAGYLLRHYVDPDITKDLLGAWNIVKNQPALSDGEVKKTVDSIMKCELRRRAKFYGGSHA